MGTNYYLQDRPPCDCCGRPYDALHIGKSSGGWVFALHVIPERRLNDLPDWEAAWQGKRIVDEYDHEVSRDEMRRIIADRSTSRGFDGQWWLGYKSEADFHQQNHSERGPNGLLRHRIGRYCVGNGEGTWDLMPGEFS